jgi:D-alanyl-D-alanine carboxypeptidase
MAAVTGLTACGVLASSTAALATEPTGVVQQGLDDLVTDGGFPAALADVREADGDHRGYAAGVADLATGEPAVPGEEVRIGSNTKTFTAVAVLQLVDEGTVDLDASIETYLPGLVRGPVDGNDITVRQVLQHTSGVPSYTDTFTSVQEVVDLRHTYVQPMELVRMGLSLPAPFPPGEGWAYSNTNYVLAGLLVEKVTGRPLAEELGARIIDRLDLRETYFPAVGEQTLRGDHPRGYHRVEDPAVPPLDVTDQDPAFAWAAGAIVSTPAELNRFFTALFGGELTSPELLAQVRDTVATPFPGEAYGLGVISRELSCGELAWGHGGDIPGTSTRGGVTDDGRAVSVAVTALPTDEAGLKALDAAVDRMLCS